MRLLALSAAALSLAMLATPATASDDRVRSILFAPDTVVRFVGKPGYQSAIRFGPDERIENVAVGDSMAWQVTPNRRGDLLFVKPLVPGARSNMTVITDKRTYLFDLEAPRSGQPIYALSFEYPTWPAAGAVEPPPSPEEPAVKTVVAVAELPPAPPPQRNGWSARGAKSLLPAQAYDDGSSLYLSWPANSALPAVLLPGPDGTEGPLNYRVAGGFIVVDGVPSQLILRRGSERAIITPTAIPAKGVRRASLESRNEDR